MARSHRFPAPPKDFLRPLEFRYERFKDGITLLKADRANNLAARNDHRDGSRNRELARSRRIRGRS